MCFVSCCNFWGCICFSNAGILVKLKVEEHLLTSSTCWDDGGVPKNLLDETPHFSRVGTRDNYRWRVNAVG